MSIYFDAVGDYVKQTNYTGITPFGSSSAASVFMRVKFNSAPAADVNMLMAYDSTGGTPFWKLYWQNSNARIQFTADNSATAAVVANSTSGITLTNWFDVAFTSNASTATLYVKVTGTSTWYTATSSVFTGTQTPFTNGWLAIPNLSGDGLINVYDFRMWAAALSSADLLAEAASDTIVRTTNAWCNCPFSAAGSYSDTSEGSYTSSGRNFTAVGTPTTGAAEYAFTSNLPKAAFFYSMLRNAG